MLKKFLVFLLIMLAVVVGVVYHYRFEIFQFSAEAIIMKNLPPFVSIDRIIFNLKDNTLEVKGFSVKNPPGYSSKHLATIDNITCRYKKQGENIIDGIEVTDITAQNPVINIERLRDSRVNVNEMDSVMAAGAPKRTEPQKAEPEKKRALPKVTDKSISELVKLPKEIDLKSGKIVFTDRAVMNRPYMLTFDDVNGVVGLSLSKDYREVLGVTSSGTGAVNDDRSQKLRWVVSFDPTKPDLSMSNRFEPSNVDIVPFRPYFDEYSPIYIERGTMSGTLVFDFDNGNIGSTNLLRLSGLKFQIKKDMPGSQYWGSMVPDLIRYLSSSPGEIVFDFTIKGDMRRPQFSPGKRTQEAIAEGVMTDTFKALMEKGEGGAGGAQPAQGGAQPKSDAEQVMELLQGILKK